MDVDRRRYRDRRHHRACAGAARRSRLSSNCRRSAALEQGGAAGVVESVKAAARCLCAGLRRGRRGQSGHRRRAEPGEFRSEGEGLVLQDEDDRPGRARRPDGRRRLQVADRTGHERAHRHRSSRRSTEQAGRAFAATDFERDDSSAATSVRRHRTLPTMLETVGAASLDALIDQAVPASIRRARRSMSARHCRSPRPSRACARSRRRTACSAR